MSRRHDVFVGIASIPSREATLRKVVRRLLPQAKQIGVYLNQYERVPGFLKRGRVVVARSQDHGDLRDNGKFFFLDQSDARYYATADDDILYPRDYLSQLIRTLDDSGQTAGVGVHGAVYPSPVVEFFNPRLTFGFSQIVPHVMPVHLLGTGTSLIDQRDWKLEFSEFGQPGMADVWLAAAAARRGIRLFVTRRPRFWLSPLPVDNGGESEGTLYFEGLLDSSHQSAVLRNLGAAWPENDRLIESLLESRRFTEALSLHQALQLDLIRTQLGYPPISENLAATAKKRLDARVEPWAVGTVLNRDEIDSLNALTIAILSDRVSAAEVMPVIDTLERLSGLERQHWAALPAAIQFDSSPERLESLRTKVFELGMRHSEIDAKQLWNSKAESVDVSLGAALLAERASVETGFERLPTFHELVKEAPESAKARLFDYFDAIDWRRAPDFSALRAVFGDEYDSLELQFLTCVAAARSGALEFARRTSGDLLARLPWDRDVRILSAAVNASEGSAMDLLEPVLDVLDDALTPQGLSPYRDLIRPEIEANHWIDQFRTELASSPGELGSEPEVSVIMTSYNDVEVIGSAMRSILASADVDLQLIVVDDASTDGTTDVIASIRNDRVVVVRNDTNLGPYQSRNRGLEVATGRFVAIADADDWSHPQRLAYQASILNRSPDLVACKVAHIRVRSSGVVDLENHIRFVGDGPMSLMFRRWLVDHIGGFDHIRSRGDIEFMRRIKARFGDGALASFDTPLVIATSSATSNSKRFSDEALNIYRTASRNWHETRAFSDSLYVPLVGERAPFMAPYDLLVARPTS